jgi:4-amino-4-deoxy-L-arabinose transferase-like glycosyltransferase
VLALAVRLIFLAADPHPYADSGLAADSAEVARQIDVHGRWFESNLIALNQLGNLQNQRLRLVDPSSVDFRSADAHPRLQPEALQPPGEAIVLAAIWKVSGQQQWLPYLVLMVVLGALMAPLVFFISHQLFRRRAAAYGAGALYAVFPPLAWLSTIPHLDSWGVDLTIVITALLLRARMSERPARWLAAAGLVAGFGCFFRPEMLLIAPLVALATLSRPRWREAVRMAAVPSLMAIVILIPWTIRNADVFHKFIPVRIGTGQALWEGLGELHNNFGAVLDDTATYRQVHTVRPDLVYGSPAYDSFLETKAIRAIRTRPGFYLKLVGSRIAKATLLLHNDEWTRPRVPVEVGLAKILEPGLFVFSILVLVLTRRRFGRSHAVLAAIIAATIVPYVLLHLEPRYVLPASFAYLIWTALGVDLLAERLASRSIRSLPDVRHLRRSRHLSQFRRQ